MWIAGAGIAAALFLYKATWRVMLDIHKFKTVRKHDKVLLQQFEQQKKLDAVRILPPDEHGYQGIVFDGQTFRNLDDMSAFDMISIKFFDPLLAQMTQQRKMLTAIAQSVNVNPDIMGKIVDATEIKPVWPSIVRPSDLLQEGPTSYRSLALGMTYENNQWSVVRRDMESMVHILIAGMTRWGKSTFLEWLAYQFATCQESVKLALIDVGVNTFGAFADCDRLLWPIADDDEKAAAVIHALFSEMKKRQDLYKPFEKERVRKLSDYNAIVDPEKRLDPIVCLIDEAPAFFESHGTKEEIIALSRMAGKTGVWLGIAGTDFNFKTVPTSARGNFATRFVARIRPTLSQPLIDCRDAADLKQKGRMLMYMPDDQSLIEIQTPLMESGDFAKVRTGGPIDKMPSFAPAIPKETRVIEMHEQDKSDTAIARKVFGHGTTYYIEKVRGILRQQQEEPV